MEAVLSRKEKGGEEAAAAMALSYKTLGVISLLAFLLYPSHIWETLSPWKA